jgi:16S rRNA (cytidine1402-2'-O)-methyltransferase
MGTLFLVATPIGNLEDISARALKILRTADLVAAEDTRHTRQLMAAFDLHTPLTSYHEHNKLIKIDAILAALDRGSVALVSDAGTPALNDPGYELVRAALDAGHAVTPIPGPAAPIAALVSSGLPTDTFIYLGFLPRKSSERAALLKQVAGLPQTLIFLEAPHRLLEALQDLEIGLGDRQAAVARELSKIHEEIFRGSLSAARQHFTETGVRGEITLVVAGNPPAAEKSWDEGRLLAEIELGVKEGVSTGALAQQLATASGWPRKEIYRAIVGFTNKA